LISIQGGERIVHLKRLELYGFKTFADSTEFEFEKGITAIVGPNGSGKSNIADAILWVLGERSLRALRGSQPTDVIFNGSSQRKPLGLAEVALTVDNSDGHLPLDFTEITVTRRLHRSGDSEFYINKRPCRLKDIYELFLDTGVGKQSYSVITQTQVDAILSLRPEDRRALFEEVAGIRKYRYRKEETLRKLEQTEHNLIRIGDLMYGIESQLGPLQEQAAVAHEYVALRDRARTLKLALLVKDYDLLQRRLERAAAEGAELQQQVASAQASLAQLEAQEQQIRLELTHHEEGLEEVRQRVADLATALERLEGQQAVAQERRQALADRAQLLEAEIALRHDRFAQAERDLQAVREERARLEQEYQTHQTRLALYQQEAAQILAEIEQADAATGAQRRALLEVAEQLSAQENQIQYHQALRQDSEERLAALERERRRLLALAEKLAERVDGCVRHLAEARQDLAAVQAQVQEYHQRAQALEEARQKVRARIAELRETISDRKSRQRVLQEMEANYEGFYRGVKTVLRARDSGALAGRYEVVAEVLQVPPECETALEAALGSSLQDILTETATQARSAIEYLKRRQGGRATFWALDLVNGSPPPPQLRALRSAPGVIGLALDLVQFDPRYAPVFQHLLARVVVVEDLDAALEVRRRIGPAGKIVTREGDLILPSGALTGGSANGRGPALLTRKREIAELHAELERLNQELAAQAAQEARLAEEHQALLEARERSEKAAHQQRDYVAESERKLLTARHEQEQIGRDLTRLETEKRQRRERQARAEAALQELQEQVAALQRQRAELEASLQEHESTLSAERRRSERAAERIAEQQILLTRWEGERRSLQAEEARLEKVQQTALEERHRLEEERQTNAQQQEQLAALMERQRQRLTELQEERQQAERELKTRQTAREELLLRVSDTLQQARQRRESLHHLQQAQHRSELRQAQIEAEITHLRAELAEDYDDLTPEQARQQAIDLPNRQAAAEELQALQTALREMGDVNVGAIEELQRLTDRLQFLREQRADLERAKVQLKQVIAEIDDTTKHQFLETFQAVGREFEALFRRIFGQGSTELVLTEPADLLNSGVEILVQMPGKRRQNLLLLSGGERAMTAIVLLFAMFRVKPSPFCVLDELDAPLDDVNVLKFTELLQEFASLSQFIVITHNKYTMEAADVLYGVTMAEPGVSSRCSYRFADGNGKGDRRALDRSQVETVGGAPTAPRP
jgi:chromosome segregation protein